MILNNIEDLHIPIDEVWSKIKYKNLGLKSKLNILINTKKLITIFDEDIDEIFIHAIKYFENLSNFIIFGKNKNDAYRYYVSHLKDKYILYGIKTIDFEAVHIMKLMYQLIFPRCAIKSKQELYDHVYKKYGFLYKQFVDNPTMPININILIVCKRDLHQRYPMHDISESNFVIYYPRNDEEKEISASLFFNKTSLKFIELQCFEHFIKKENNESKMMFLKYRSWIYENIDVLTRSSQFMLFSSVVLYLIGHRAMNDLDLYIHSLSEELCNDVNFAFDNNEEFNFIEYQIKGTEKWPHYWDTWLDIWAQKCGAKYVEEILGNPEYHFYYLGVKIISLHCDLVRRIERQRPRAYADLLSFRKRYAYKIDIPSIPKNSWKYIKLSAISESEKDALIKKGGVIDEENQEIKLEEEINCDKFLGTIIYALKENYRMDMTISDIKRDLHMYDDKESLSSILRMNKNKNSKLERPDNAALTVNLPPKNIKIVIKKSIK